MHGCGPPASNARIQNPRRLCLYRARVAETMQRANSARTRPACDVARRLLRPPYTRTILPGLLVPYSDIGIDQQPDVISVYLNWVSSAIQKDFWATGSSRPKCPHPDSLRFGLGGAPLHQVIPTIGAQGQMVPRVIRR